MCIPLPKGIIQRIDRLYRVFLRTGKGKPSRKAHVAWRIICITKNQGGQNVISLKECSKALMMKLLWNLYKKEDNLWIKLVHAYYVKNDDFMIVPMKPSCSWISRRIL